MDTLIMMALLKISRFRNVSIGRLILSPLILLILLCGAYLLRPSFRARYLFNELETLQLGHSTFEDAKLLAKKIDAKPSVYGPCDRSGCTWEKRIDNAELPRWWRGS